MRDNRDQETQRQKRKKVFQKEKNQGEENRGDVQRDCVEHKSFDWLLVSSIKKQCIQGHIKCTYLLTYIIILWEVRFF